MKTYFENRYIYRVLVLIKAGITAILYLQYLCWLQVTGLVCRVRMLVATHHQSSPATSSRQQPAAGYRPGHGDGTRKICTGCNNTNNTQHSVTLCPAQQIFLAEIPKINA